MKLREPMLPQGAQSAFERALVAALVDFMRAVVLKTNALASGAAAETDNASAAMPTTGLYAAGDYVAKASPAVAGTAGSQYVVYGWKRLTGGAAHVLNTDWVEDRRLTGT